jgi:hypothetical protein
MCPFGPKIPNTVSFELDCLCLVWFDLISLDGGSVGVSMIQYCSFWVTARGNIRRKGPLGWCVIVQFIVLPASKSVVAALGDCPSHTVLVLLVSLVVKLISQVDCCEHDSLCIDYLIVSWINVWWDPFGEPFVCVQKHGCIFIVAYNYICWISFCIWFCYVGSHMCCLGYLLGCWFDCVIC